LGRCCLASCEQPVWWINWPTNTNGFCPGSSNVTWHERHWKVAAMADPRPCVQPADSLVELYRGLLAWRVEFPTDGASFMCRWDFVLYGGRVCYRCLGRWFGSPAPACSAGCCWSACVLGGVVWRL